MFAVDLFVWYFRTGVLFSFYWSIFRLQSHATVSGNASREDQLPPKRHGYFLIVFVFVFYLRKFVASISCFRETHRTAMRTTGDVVGIFEVPAVTTWQKFCLIMRYIVSATSVYHLWTREPCLNTYKHTGYIIFITHYILSSNATTLTDLSAASFYLT